MNNREVCHIWANQSRASAKGSNLFFEGPVIYSYGRHFPIARVVDSGPLILFTTNGYSATTAKHKSYARSAIPHYVRVLYVPDVCANYPGTHSANLQAIIDARETAILKASRARSNGELHIRDAETLASDARTYAAAFGLPVPSFEEISAELLAQTAERAAEAAKARAAESRERAAARKEQEAQDAREYAEKEAQWMRGARVSLPYRHDAITRLRLRGDVIETSRGASVPASVAPRLWQFAKDCRANGIAHDFLSSDGTAVGDYELREIRADGALVIGCHVLEFAEVSRMCAILGLPAYAEG